MTGRHQVVVVGGGFAGLMVARKLRKEPVDVTLIDRRNFHLFQPLLYQVATGELSPANIASPIRAIVRRQKNCEVLLGEVTGFDVTNRAVLLDGDRERVPYDTLVMAAGATHSYFGHQDWEAHAPGLKTIEDATEIRKRILVAFEAAERESDPDIRREWLRFVIVGAGPTGVELAGALSEVARHTLRHDFRRIDPTEAEVIIVEAAAGPLQMYPEKLIEAARRSLKQLRVIVRDKTMVTGITPTKVTVVHEGESSEIRTRTVLWAAGVAASPLGKKLAEATGAEVDRPGRVIVSADMTVPHHPELFVIGDLAHAEQDGRPLPGLAPVAMQQGEYVARTIRNRLSGRPTSPFHYKDHGSMAVIGRYSAIAVINRLKVSGVFAWLLWLFIHLMSLVQFQNRLLVFMQWGWTYLTRNRTARLITGFDPRDLPLTEHSAAPDMTEPRETVEPRSALP